MANVQTYFNKFHDTIRRSYNDNSILRDKRDLLLRDLQEGLRRYALASGIKIPRYEHFNQGSYAMDTGIEPLSGEDYDIDVGLTFHISASTYSPVEVKQWVYEALNSGNRTVEYKRPCVRVQYHRKGEEIYHVDFAVYSGKAYNWDNQTYLAKGFLGSAPENQVWEISEPHGLLEAFQQKFPNEGDRNQFRRVIRFLKRWKDVNFTAEGNARPTGIALTACAMNWFQRGLVYRAAVGTNYDDLTALRNLAESILSQFDFGNRISVRLPVPPHNDLFEKLSNKQMANLESKLAVLVTSLTRAQEESSYVSACRILHRLFGDDFLP